MATVTELYEQSTAAFNNHDRAAFAEFIDDTCEAVGPGGMQATGKEACIEFSWAWVEACPDSRGTVHATYAAGDTVTAEGTFTGTHTGVLHSPMGDIQPTGRTIKGDYIQVLRFRDGKAVYQHLMFDRLELLEQLGLMPAAAGA